MEVVVCAAIRTAIGKFGGALRETPTVDMAAAVIRGLLDRTGLAPDQVDEVDLGVTVQAECEDLAAPVIARQALLKAGLPPETVSLTVERACCSGLTAIQTGWRSLKLGEARAVIAGGADCLSRAPMVVRPLRWGSRLGHIKIRDPLFELGYQDFAPLARDAGEVAVELGITRAEQDGWALRSQQRFAAAAQRGVWQEEIIPLQVPGPRRQPVTFAVDEFPKPDTTLAGLAALPTIYGSPTVTPGNAPGLNDGAAALLLTTRDRARALGLPVLATVVDCVSTAADPRLIATVPARAVSTLLNRNRLGLSEVDLLEINEAFAAVPLCSTKLLGEGDPDRVAALREKTNVNGGAIALGHPLGASGARIVVTLLHELRRRQARHGVAAICGGLGQGDALLLRVD